jgi:hypothetical protein
MRRQQPIDRAPVRLTVGAGEREGERRQQQQQQQQQQTHSHAAGNGGDGRGNMISNNGHMNLGGPKQPIRRRGNIY